MVSRTAMFRRGKVPKLPGCFEKWNAVTGGSGRQPAKLRGLNPKHIASPCQMPLLPV